MVTLTRGLLLILGILALTGLLANIAIVVVLFFIVRKGGILSVGFIQDDEDDGEGSY